MWDRLEESRCQQRAPTAVVAEFHLRRWAPAFNGRAPAFNGGAPAVSGWDTALAAEFSSKHPHPPPFTAIGVRSQNVFTGYLYVQYNYRGHPGLIDVIACYLPIAGTSCWLTARHIYSRQGTPRQRVYLFPQISS